MPAFDIERARRDTRGCVKRIHFNNAGASLPPAVVSDALVDYLRAEEEQGGYEVMARRAAELENFYFAASRLLNCTPEEIAFADSATRAWNAAFYALEIQRGDRILVSGAEYGSSLVALLHRARMTGAELVQVPDAPDGKIDIDALVPLIDKRTRLICLTMVPSGLGLVNPAAEVGRIAREYQIPYLLDGCQALGQMPVDVEQIGCDLLCGTGRKFLRGPRGTGLLYVRKSLLEDLVPSQLNHHAADLISATEYHLRPDARRFETWERSYGGQLGLAVAIDYALDWGLELIAEQIAGLTKILYSRLSKLDGVLVQDLPEPCCGILNFRIPGRDATEIQERLAADGINLSTVPYSANPLGASFGQCASQLRVSPHYYNTTAEVEIFAEYLARQLR